MAINFTPGDVPEGMSAVTRKKFFEIVGPMDVLLVNADARYTLWETRMRTPVGVTTPGWKNPGDPKAYFLAGWVL